MCQGFSVVGRARIRSLSSAAATRNPGTNELYDLFFHFVEAAQPSIFVMENVNSLKSWAEGDYYKAMWDSILIWGTSVSLGFERR